MKKLLISAILCIMSITASYEAAHALNPYTIKREAEGGMVHSQFLLAILYTTGAESEIIQPDPHKAREWYEKAALQGHPGAQLALASIYETGHFVERDMKKAFMWYEKAANCGFSIALVRMGEFYEKGIDVEKDLAKAMEWYEKGVLANNEEAKVRLDNLKKKMTASQKAQAEAAQPAEAAKP